MPHNYFKLYLKSNFILLLLFTKLVSALPTTLSGQDYIDQCASYDVPTPLTWGGNNGGFGWNRIGELGDRSHPGVHFITTFNSTLNTVIYTYESDNPYGTCITLKRPNFDNNGLDHVDVICLGIVSSKACFWEGLDVDPNRDNVPLTEFNGGSALFTLFGSNLNCGSCHAGENPFIIHPNTPLSNPNLGNIELNSLEWYDPILPSQFSQNAGPLITEQDGACFSCHRSISDGGIGRLPKISLELNADWCETVLDNAAEETMPPISGEAGGIPNVVDPNERQLYQTHKDLLRNMCNLPRSPQIRIKETKLIFGDVQLGYSHAKTLIIHNDGDAFLKFSVAANIQNTAWSEIPSVTDIIINPGDEPVVLTYVFTPQNVGPQNLTLQVSYSGQSIVDNSQNITLTGRGVTPFPFDTVLLLDRSGSMADDLNGRDKIKSMRVATNLYADLLRENIDYNNGISFLDFAIGDRLGMVKYNGQSQILFPIKTIDETQRIAETDITDTNILAPTGLTGIGGAMIRASNMLLTVEPNSSGVTPLIGTAKQVMIVLTDGKENTAPFIDDVIGSIQALNPDLITYSVGIGSDVNADKLQNITNVSDGYHQIVKDFSGLELFSLEDFYFKIFADAREHDILYLENSPAMTLGVLNNSTPQIKGMLNVDSSAREVNFLILDDPAMRLYYQLELIAPTGDVVNPGLIQGVGVNIFAHGFETGEIIENSPTIDLEINTISHDTYKIYNVKFIGNGKYSPYFGQWSLKLTPNGFWPQLIEPVTSSSTFNYASNGINPFAGFVPIGFTAAIGSNFRLNAKLITQDYNLNSSILMTATLSDRQLPVTEGNVIVTITKPFGSSLNNDPIPFDVQLYDDATHGDLIKGDGTWTNQFNGTDQLGVYQFVFKASGQNSNNETAYRKASKYMTISR